MPIVLMILSIITAIPKLIEAFNVIMDLIGKLQDPKDRAAAKRLVRKACQRHATFESCAAGKPVAKVGDEEALAKRLDEIRARLEAKLAGNQ